MSETKSPPGCDRCGQRAIVHISAFPGNARLVRHFCLACADDEVYRAAIRQQRVNFSAVILCVGLIVLVLSLSADVLAFGNSEGFGWQQRTGWAIGAALFLIGAIVRVGTLVVIGLFAGTLALLADWLAFGSGQGFGRQQFAGVLLGIAVSVLGLWRASTSAVDGAKAQSTPRLSGSSTRKLVE